MEILMRAAPPSEPFARFYGGQWGDSPLIPEKKEVPDCDRDRLKQDQPAHETPLRFRLAVFHSPVQRRLREDEGRDHFSGFLPADVSLKPNLFDRFASIALRQRLQRFLGKVVFHS